MPENEVLEVSNDTDPAMPVVPPVSGPDLYQLESKEETVITTPDVWNEQGRLISHPFNDVR